MYLCLLPIRERYYFNEYHIDKTNTSVNFTLTTLPVHSPSLYLSISNNIFQNCAKVWRYVQSVIWRWIHNDSLLSQRDQRHPRVELSRFLRLLITSFPTVFALETKNKFPISGQNEVDAARRARSITTVFAARETWLRLNGTSRFVDADDNREMARKLARRRCTRGLFSASHNYSRQANRRTVTQFRKRYTCRRQRELPTRRMYDATVRFGMYARPHLQLFETYKNFRGEPRADEARSECAIPSRWKFHWVLQPRPLGNDPFGSERSVRDAKPLFLRKQEKRGKTDTKHARRVYVQRERSESATGVWLKSIPFLFTVFCAASFSGDW